jgi:hypothetical protein
MPIGAGKLFSGSNANRLRGDGTPTSAFSITSTVPDHRSFRYDISTTYAEGAELYVLLTFSQQIYPELFGYSFDQVALPGAWPLPIDNYKLSANVTVDANGNASINSSINLHQLTNTANTIAFATTGMTAIVFQQDSSGPNVGSDSGVTLKRDTQDLLEITNQSGGSLVTGSYGALGGANNYTWDDWFPAAVDEGWDSTDFTHIRYITYTGTTSSGGSTGTADWGVDSGTFQEPLIPSTNKDLPIHAVLRGGNRINTDLYLINPPSTEAFWFNGQYSTWDIRVGYYNTLPSATNLEYRPATLGNTVTVDADGYQKLPPYPAPPNPAIPMNQNSAEIALWYPSRGPDGVFITANTR